MPNPIPSVPFSHPHTSSSSVTSQQFYNEYDMASMSDAGSINSSSTDSLNSRPILHLTGTRNIDTNQVTILCRCTGIPVYTHPIIALFVCRDTYTERDRFTYLGQTSPTVPDGATELECIFKIDNCRPPIQIEREEEELQLTPRSLADYMSRPRVERPSAPTTQLKLNVYATNTPNSTFGDGALQPQDIIGTAFVDLERLLDHCIVSDDRVVSVELSRLSHHHLVLSPTSSSNSSVLTSSTGTPNYTTLRIPHQIPPASSMSIASSPMSLGLYGVNEESIKSVLETPALPESRLEEEHAAFMQRQREEQAKAEKRGKPIEEPKKSRYELGASTSPSLIEHNQNRRMCSSEECVIC